MSEMRRSKTAGLHDKAHIASEEAAEWLLKLEEADGLFNQDFVDWLTKSPANVGAFLRAKATDELFRDIDPGKRLPIEWGPYSEPDAEADEVTPMGAEAKGAARRPSPVASGSRWLPDLLCIQARLLRDTLTNALLFVLLGSAALLIERTVIWMGLYGISGWVLTGVSRLFLVMDGVVFLSIQLFLIRHGLGEVRHRLAMRLAERLPARERKIAKRDLAMMSMQEIERARGISLWRRLAEVRELFRRLIESPLVGKKKQRKYAISSGVMPHSGAMPGADAGRQISSRRA